jgi:hypothetical protein
VKHFDVNYIDSITSLSDIRLLIPELKNLGFNKINSVLTHWILLKMRRL